MIGHIAYRKAFEKPCQLYDEHDGNINHDQNIHILFTSLLVQDIGKTLGKLSLKIWKQSNPDVVDQSCDSNQHHQFPFHLYIMHEFSFLMCFLHYFHYKAKHLDVS